MMTDSSINKVNIVVGAKSQKPQNQIRKFQKVENIIGRDPTFFALDFFFNSLYYMFQSLLALPIEFLTLKQAVLALPH